MISPDRICPHSMRMTFEDWSSSIKELGKRMSKLESVTPIVYYAYPFRELCPDCQYVVFLQGPESLKGLVE